MQQEGVVQEVRLVGVEMDRLMVTLCKIKDSACNFKACHNQFKRNVGIMGDLQNGPVNS